MRKLLLSLMLLSAALLLLYPSSHAQFIVVGQGCGASGLTAISNNGYPVVCTGNPLVWTIAGAPSASPGGSSGQVQFNNAGAFGGSAAFTFATGNPNVLTVGQAAISTGVITLIASASSPNLAGSLTVPNQINASGGLSATNYVTATNCTSATGTCGSAAAGAVTIAAAASTVTVATTAVTANSDISLTFNSALGTRLGVTCNTTAQQPFVSTITAGTSFVISTPATFTTNPGCITYDIKN